MMFAIAADYLMGWAMASADGANKKQAEWPPHPDRVFMALAAAWFETEADPLEGEALRWLEALPPPSLCASGHEPRDATVHFVPVNDTTLSGAKVIAAIVDAASLALDKAKDAGLAQLPTYRSRQPRTFPVAVPYVPIVHLRWDAPLPEQHRSPLAALCAKATSIGHSASLVRMWLDEAPPAASWAPGEGPTTVRMRISGAGRLAHLERRFNKQGMLAHAQMKQALQLAKGPAKKALQRELEDRFPMAPVSLRPEPGVWQGYLPVTETTDPATPVAAGVFDDRLVVLSLHGQRLGLRSTLLVTAALRGAMLSGCMQPLPEWLSGHTPDGKASRQPHVALLPLAFTRGQHADGRLMGVAIALPRSVNAAEAARAFEPWLRHGDAGSPRELRLFDGRDLECTALLETRERPPLTLIAREWTGPARRWSTITPIALDRHPAGPGAWEQAAEVVANSCERIGLPRPIAVSLHPNSIIEGVPPSRSFTPVERKRGGGRLAHIHAVITFDRDVLGPVVLGAGRFRGYGFCKPVATEGAQYG